MITPSTKRLIVLCLGAIGLLCVGGEIALLALGKTPPEALTVVASGAVGALGGALIPDGKDDA